MRTYLLLSAAIFCMATVARAGDESKRTAAGPNGDVAVAKDAEAAAGDQTDADKPPIVFDGETFVFAWEGESPTTKIKEFLPKGQNLDTWTRFVAINEYPHVDDPREFAQGIVDALKKQNPKAGAQLQVNEKTGDVVLDFVTFPDDQSFIEFDVFKFHKLPEGGVLGEQFAQRAYAVEDQQALLDNLPELKKRVLPLMAEHGLQQ